MKKPLRYFEKRFLRFSSKPLLTFSILILILFGLKAQPSGSIVDPCVCMSNSSCPDDGQFTATLRIINGGAGPWYIAEDSVNGFYANPSPAPPAQPTALATGPGGVSFIDLTGGVFELTGIHVDGQGFWLLATDGSSDTIAFQHAGCSYPHTAITGDRFVCKNQESAYSTPLNAGSSYSWTLSGGGTMSIPPTNNDVTVAWGAVSGSAVYQLSVTETSVHGCVETSTLPVMIEDTLTMACNDMVFVSVDANCNGELTADMFLEGMQYENASYSITLQDAGGVFINPPVLHESMIGKTYMVTVTQLCSGNNCMSLMRVFDKRPPELFCKSDTVGCNDGIRPQDFTPFGSGFPLEGYSSINTTTNPNIYIAIGAGSCSDLTLRYSDEIINHECNDPEFTTTIYRTWIVSDESGNVSVCMDTIFVIRSGLEDLGYPKNWDGLPGNNNFIEACSIYPKNSEGYPDPSYTGEPTGPLCGNLWITYKDKILYICPPDKNSYKVLRHWLVIDVCTSESFDTVQIIAIMDTKPPTVSIPGVINNKITIEAKYYDCGSNFQLPVPVVSDCSSWSYTVKYQLADGDGNFPPEHIPYLSVPFIGGKYVITDIPKGLARAKYIVTDACGNATERIIIIEVIDNLPPQAVCDENTSISIKENGFGYIEKLTFDDGSHDNCSDITFRARRLESTCDSTDTDWKDIITFCCDDVGKSPILVELEVTDAAGLKNICTAKVWVNDDISPTITCPPNGEVSCIFDYSDLSVFGTVRTSAEDRQEIYITDPGHGGYKYFGLDGFAADNCNVTVEALSSSVNINNCGTGTITRSFRARDDANNYSNVCVQTIQVNNFKPFLPSRDLLWPSDYTVNACIDDDLHPDNLPVQYGWPRITGDERCSMIGIDFDDLVFYNVDEICYKIMRKWRVIDWCQYTSVHPLPAAGYWEYTQYIMVNDNVKPTISSGCQPLETVALGNCQYRVSFSADGSDNCTPPENLKWEYELRINDNPSTTVKGTSKSFSTTLSIGTHRIIWRLTDFCGNTDQCSQTFTIRDDKKPTPVCITELVTVLMPSTGEVTINAANYNVASYDDCTKSNYGLCDCLTDLRFSFSSNVNNTTRLLTCDDIEEGRVDTVELQVWVTDEAGNQDYCTVYIVLQDNHEICPGPPHQTVYYDLSGFVRKPNEEPVDVAVIRLRNEMPEFTEQFNTDNDGKFSFKGLADEQSYYIEAEKTGDYANGLSTLDILLIQKHILNIARLEDPYKLLAADVNNSGSVTAADILELRKVILGESTEFKLSPSWRLIDRELKLTPNDNLKNLSSRIFIGNQTADIEKNYVAIKIGDVNFSAHTGSSGNLDPRSKNEFLFIADEKEFYNGEYISLELKASTDINFMGAQFTLEFDASRLNFINAESSIMNINSNNLNILNAQNGVITISINESVAKALSTGEIMMSFNFESTGGGMMSRSANITSAITEAEVYETYNGGINERPIELRYDNDADDLRFEVYQNMPNPFSESTVIAYVLPEQGTATLYVFDLHGKELFRQSKEGVKGYNEFELNNKDLDKIGMLYYKIESGQHYEMKKLILIR